MDWDFKTIMAARAILIDNGHLVDMETVRAALTAAIEAQELNPQAIKDAKDLAYEHGYRDALSKVMQSLLDMREKSNAKLAAHNNSRKKQQSDTWTL